MTKLFHIHPKDPQLRLIRQVVDIVNSGGIVAYPTDSAYALGCRVGDKQALDRIRSIRSLTKKHNFTLVCRDLSELSLYANVVNSTYRLLKAYTPGPYTFILTASKEVPRRLQHPKRKTIGLRIPDNKIVLSLLEEMKEPLMSVTLIMPDEKLPLPDPEDIFIRLENRIDAIVDGGFCGFEPTTVVDFIDDVPTVVRTGKGDSSNFEISHARA